MNLLLEVFTVISSLTYLVLLMRENIWCWFFGIISSATSIYLFISAHLYSEAILYAYYVLIGIYGWSRWRKKTSNESLKVHRLPWRNHIWFVAGGAVAAFGLAYLFQNFTDAEKTKVDAFTTIFSFIASYLEANKILSSWIFWILINAVNIWLYYTQGLPIYAGLMVIYLITSFLGYQTWNKRLMTSP